MNADTRAVNGIKWTSASVILKALLQLSQLIILVRLLDKSDFGIMAILIFFISFCQVFVDFGISKSIIYHQDISRKELGALYFINILFGFLTYAVLFLIAGYISDFYSEPLLCGYLRLIGLILIIQSFGLQFDVLFQKSLKFNIIAKIEIISAFASFLSAIIMGINGLGVLALIYSAIIMTAVKASMLMFWGIKAYGLQLIFTIKYIRRHVVFGVYIVSNAMISNISSQIDTILVGKFMGSEVLGLYSVLKELILRPSQIISPIVTKVSFPLMSELNYDLMAVKLMYMKIINYISSILFPLYVITIIFAKEIILIFLGAKWLDGVVIFQILAIWAMLYSISDPVGCLIMAVGRPDISMYWSIAGLFYMPMVIYISSFFGQLGIALGMLIISILLYIPAWYFLVYRLCGATLKEYFHGSLSSIYISAIVGISLYFIIQFLPNILYLRLFIGLIAGIMLSLFLNKILNKDFYNSVLSLFRK